MDLRRASANDYELLLPLFLGLREFSRAGHPPQRDDFALVLAASHAYLREVLARGLECQTLLALAGDGRLAGYLIVSVHEPNPLTSSGAIRTGSIDELFVSATHRGSGAGSLLVETACNWLVEQRAERVEVGAYAWNTAGIGFYEREGFAVWSVTLMKPLGSDDT